MFGEYEAIFESIPCSVSGEIKRVCASRLGGVESVSELHITVGSRSSMLSHGERIYLNSRLTDEDMQRTVQRLCNGAIYAHRDSITEGYISIGGGVRVGVCGQARYESGKLVGISDVSSLVFRIPTASSSLERELLSAWGDTERGMLIYARAGVGKTTALRSIVSAIGGGNERIAVVDERCEFSVSECRRLGVIHLRGYRRQEGMEIALRTMSPDVIVVDEIGARREADGMLESLNSGIRVLATAHATSLAELMRRAGVRSFIDNGVFDTFFGIFNTDGDYSYQIERLQC